jgi:hypothetical protein
MSKQYVERRDGGYYVTGTRVSLDSVVYAFLRGESPEGIVDRGFVSVAEPRTSVRRNRLLSGIPANDYHVPSARAGRIPADARRRSP